MACRETLAVPLLRPLRGALGGERGIALCKLGAKRVGRFARPPWARMQLKAAARRRARSALWQALRGRRRRRSPRQAARSRFCAWETVRPRTRARRVRRRAGVLQSPRAESPLLPAAGVAHRRLHRCGFPDRGSAPDVNPTYCIISAVAVLPYGEERGPRVALHPRETARYSRHVEVMGANVALELTPGDWCRHEAFAWARSEYAATAVDPSALRR